MSTSKPKYVVRRCVSNRPHLDHYWQVWEVPNNRRFACDSWDDAWDLIRELEWHPWSYRSQT